MMFKTTAALTFLALVLLPVSDIQADTFGSGSNMFDIPFVTIGNPGNAADTTGLPDPAGSVDKTYRIGQFVISEDIIDKANAESGLGITKDTRGPNKPATSVSWLEAAQFVNWLNTDSGSTEAYKFSGSTFELWTPGDAGYNPNNLYRNSQAKYFLPSVDEWYKAAYYDPSGTYFDYPTGSNTAPTAVASGTTAGTAVHGQSFVQGPADIMQAGGLSPYGTMGQGGNVFEWEETSFDLLNNSSSSARGVRGGNWISSFFILLSSLRFDDIPSFEDDDTGFRVASRYLGDSDNDSDVDGADFLLWQQGFGGTYDENDFAIWEDNFGAPEASLAAGIANVPEPTTSALVLAAALLLSIARPRSR